MSEPTVDGRLAARPASVQELAELVPSRPRWHVRGAGTKPALSTPAAGVPVLDLSALTGIVEYSPEECTFTALAGTPIAAIERVLAPHRQYLPFDPPLAQAGATLGGTVAAGVNGSCRYRFGGIRDFVIGARIVDGEGRVIHSGGKVVKNAAGFLLHQALVGSCGALGVLGELTFKVFPEAEAHATVRAETGGIPDALEMLAALKRARIDLEAVDITPPGTVWARLGGFADALETRIAGLSQVMGATAAALTAGDDAAVWEGAREFTWARRGVTLARVPTTPPRLSALHDRLAGHDVDVRYSVAGNVAWIAWPEALDALDVLLREQGLVGQLLLGSPVRPMIGAVAPNLFEQRVRHVMDPAQRFTAVERDAIAAAAGTRF